MHVSVYACTLYIHTHLHTSYTTHAHTRMYVFGAGFNNAAFWSGQAGDAHPAFERIAEAAVAAAREHPHLQAEVEAEVEVQELKRAKGTAKNMQRAEEEVTKNIKF